MYLRRLRHGYQVNMGSEGQLNKHSTEVVIIGGGLVGVATAYFLGLRGIESIVVERDGVGSHASGFSYAALGTFDEEGMTGRHFDVGSLGMRLHRKLAESLREETGVDVEFRERPSLGLVFDEAEAEGAQSPKDQDAVRRAWEVDEQGYSVKWVDEEEARRIEPRISPAALGGTYTEGTSDVNAGGRWRWQWGPSSGARRYAVGWSPAWREAETVFAG